MRKTVLILRHHQIARYFVRADSGVREGPAQEVDRQEDTFVVNTHGRMVRLFPAPKAFLETLNSLAELSFSPHSVPQFRHVFLDECNSATSYRSHRNSGSRRLAAKVYASPWGVCVTTQSSDEESITYRERHPCDLLIDGSLHRFPHRLHGVLRSFVLTGRENLLA